jgi:cis-L-3-hydroxyproline dehydratase
MKITRISAYAVELPSRRGPFTISNERTTDSLTTTIVQLDTDVGISGYGECCTGGPGYLDGFTDSVQAGIRKLAPSLIGLDPLETNVVNARMDALLKGQLAAKSPIDIACWDIQGKLFGVPISTLLGGKFLDSIPVFEAISLGEPEEMASRAEKLKIDGIRNYQIKLGGAPDKDILRAQAVIDEIGKWDFITCDANGWWTRAEALKVARALEEFDIFLEQPCLSIEAAADIRSRIRLPVLLCEVITGTASILEIFERNAADAINIKLARVGGLTKATQVRDLAQALNFQILIDEPAGSDIADAAKFHLAASVHPRNLIATSVNATSIKLARRDVPEVVNGRVNTITNAGLGIEIDMALMGEPLFVIQEQNE